MKTYYVYILSSKSRTIYVGVTSDLVQRILQHKNRLIPGFTCRYNIDRLVHFEEFSRVQDAIAREKQIKGWVRSKKIVLIESSNPTWEDLSAQWF